MINNILKYKIKKILLFFILFPLFSLSQQFNNLQGKKLSDLNDVELMSYWTQAQKNGYSIDQIKMLARTQGVSEIEITEFEKRIKEISGDLKSDSKKEEFDTSTLTSIFGKKINTNENKIEKEDQIIQQGRMPIFGSNYFNNENINSSPILNVATPSSYEIGPGDEILISIWGAAENEYSSTVSREGFIKIERLGPVYVSGLTIKSAKEKLVRVLGKIYSGLNISSNSEFKV